MKDENITELMKEYFSLRDETKKLKRERPYGFCEYQRDYDFGGDCISNESDEPCEYCQQTKEWIDKIYEVGRKKSAILNRVRNIVNKTL